MHHFGLLVPSTNTTVEIEYGRLLPPTSQVHVARILLLSSGAEITPRGDDADDQLALVNCVAPRADRCELVRNLRAPAVLSHAGSGQAGLLRLKQMPGAPIV